MNSKTRPTRALLYGPLFANFRPTSEKFSRLFTYNEALVVSDGVEARVGSLTADRERFMPWRTIEGETEAESTDLELEVTIKGLFDKGTVPKLS